jgi:hypothetical protein
VPNEKGEHRLGRVRRQIVTLTGPARVTTIGAFDASEITTSLRPQKCSVAGSYEQYLGRDPSRWTGLVLEGLQGDGIGRFRRPLYIVRVADRIKKMEKYWSNVASGLKVRE